MVICKQTAKTWKFISICFHIQSKQIFTWICSELQTIVLSWRVRSDAIADPLRTGLADSLVWIVHSISQLTSILLPQFMLWKLNYDLRRCNIFTWGDHNQFLWGFSCWFVLFCLMEFFSNARRPIVKNKHRIRALLIVITDTADVKVNTYNIITLCK